jgi:predicted TIM-barrel fold metal-dependent hydrolase
MATFDAFDTDTHVIEQPGTWNAVDPAFHERRLRIGADRERFQWLMHGRKKLVLLRSVFPGEIDAMRNRVRRDPLAYETMIQRRMKDPPRTLTADPPDNELGERPPIMDRMGVSQAVIYPSLSLFWPSVIDDPDFTDAHYAAWNDWIAAQTDGLGDRLLPVGQYTFHDPKKAVAEIRRCRKLGLRGLFVRAVPYRGLPWNDASYEPIWDAFEACDMPLLMHFTIMPNTSHDPTWEKKLEPRHLGFSMQTFINRALPAEAALTSLILGGVLERHPRLRIGITEFGSIWVPSFLHRLDFTVDFMGPRNRYLRELLPLAPSDYFRRQVKVSTIWNEPLAWLIRSVGDHVLMFASDFPHPEGNGKAVKLAQRGVGALPQKTQRRFFRDNARELFGDKV